MTSSSLGLRGSSPKSENKQTKHKSLSMSKRHLDDPRLRQVSTSPFQAIVPYRKILSRIQRRKKLRTLSENDYVSCLETIIERDYFPELPRLRVYNAFLRAKNSGDAPLAEQLEAKLAEFDLQDRGGVIITPNTTPNTTPNNNQNPTPNNSNEIQLQSLEGEKILVDLGKSGITLDEFHQLFNSEDNREFEAIYEKLLLKRDKWIEKMANEHNLMLSREQILTNLGIKSGNIATSKSEGANALYFYKEKKLAFNKPTQIYKGNTSLSEASIASMEMKKRAGRLRDREEAKKQQLYNMIARDGIEAHREEAWKVSDDFVQTPLITADGDEPIITWGTIGGVERLEACGEPIESSNRSDEIEKSSTANQPHKPIEQGYIMPKESVGDRVSRRILEARLAREKVKKVKAKAQTPLLVQRLIDLHSNDADYQLRESYRGRSGGSSVRSRSVLGTPR